MNTILYEEDILSQPQALQYALEKLDLSDLQPIRHLLENKQIDRVVITGMGASLYGLYPAWLLLASAGISAYLVDAAELIYYSKGLITPSTLLWIVSQSGRSAELLHLLTPGTLLQPKLLLALTNDLSSPLAHSAAAVIPIHAQPEQTVSTRTYMNTLAISQLVSLELTGIDRQSGADELQEACENLKGYLENWKVHVGELVQLVGFPPNLVILGRGPSLAAAQTGALVQQEASKFPAIALNTAEFRHGPMEMIKPEVSVILLAGPQTTLQLNQRLALNIRELGGKVYWVGDQAIPDIPLIQMPGGKGLGLPLVEIVPLQLLSLALAKQSGVQAGKFLFSGKVTLVE
jgi:glutamine---fructose-6-phosphate transaminase (isomerizing)